VHILDVSKPDADGRCKLGELTSFFSRSANSSVTNSDDKSVSGLANSIVTSSDANDLLPVDRGDSRRNSGAADDATREPSRLQRPVCWEY
jgi:hypothetical protein